MIKSAKYSLYLSCLLFCTIQADEINENSTELQEIVVTASGFSQDTKNAPASISIVTKEELASKPITSLADAISDVPGVSVNISRSNGNYEFDIRGHSSRDGYVLMLIDGKRQGMDKGFGAYDQAQGSNDFNFMPPIGAIERIEVIKGPASTLYGSDAVGGAINIITKKTPSDYTGSVTLEKSFQEHSNRDGRGIGGISGFIGGPLSEKAGFYIQAKQYKKDGGDGILYGGNNYSRYQQTDFKSQNLSGRLSYEFNENHGVFGQVDYYKQEGSRELDKYGYLLNYDGKFGEISNNSYLQYQETKWRNVSKGKSLASSFVAESKSVVPFEFKNYGSLITTAGLQYQQDRLNQSGAPNQVLTGDIKNNIISPYAEAEYFITNDLILTLGARYTHSDKFGGEFTPRIYGVYHFNDIVTFKAGITRGYKAPKIGQLFDGKFMGNNNNTDQYGNLDLTPESSINYEAGFMFDFDEILDLSIMAFQTDLSDVIGYTSYRPGSTLPNGVVCDAVRQCWYWSNKGDQRARGIEVSAKTAKFGGFDLGVNYYLLQRIYTEDASATNVGGTSNYTYKKGDRVAGYPLHTISAKLNYNYGKFNAFLKFTGKYDNLNNEGTYNRTSTQSKKYKDFYTFDLGANYRIDKHQSLNFLIVNLFDQNYIEPYSYLSGSNLIYANTYQDDTPGRSLYMSYKWEF